MGEATSHGSTEAARALITEIPEAHGTTYQLWAELHDCDTPRGLVELRFQSLWSGAREPGEPRDRGRFLLDHTALQNLRQLLDAKSTAPALTLGDVT